MDESVLKTLVKEMKEEYQIPPYHPDSALENHFNEGEAFFIALVPNANIEKDLTFKSLLKNYVFYAYHKKLDEFGVNYNSNIVTWQMSLVGRGEGNE